MRKGGYLILIISVLLMLLITVAFYFMSYKPNQAELTRARENIRQLKSEINMKEKSVAEDGKAILQADLGMINLNFFANHEAAKSEKTPFFLRELNKLANVLGIIFLSINPVASENKSNYTKETFEIIIKTDFNRLYNFLWYLQNDMGLNVDSLSMELEENEKKPEIKVSMIINSIEMTEDEDRGARTLDDLRFIHFHDEPSLRELKLAETQIMKTDLKTLDLLDYNARDPFTKPQKVQQIQERQKQAERELQEIELLGIIDFSGQRHAIIGRNTVKKGDRIFNMDVIDITHDEVVLGSDGLRFNYKIKKESYNKMTKQGEY